LDATVGKRSVNSGTGTRLAVAPDGRVAACRAGAVHWHDPESLAQVAEWPSAFPTRLNVPLSDANGFALRADGQSAHTGPGHVGPGVVVWRAAGGNVRHKLEGHAHPVTAVAFLPGDRLASADEGGAVRLCDSEGNPTALQPWAGGTVRFLVAAGARLWVG